MGIFGHGPQVLSPGSGVAPTQLLLFTHLATPPQNVPSLRLGHETSHRFQTRISNALKPVIPSPRFKGNTLPQGVGQGLSAGTWAHSSCPFSAGQSVEMSLHGFLLSDSC